MKIRTVKGLRGPNTWANFAVLEAIVDLEELKDSPSDEIPGFNDRLMAWLPTMIEHQCSIGERGGFFERLRRGTYQAHILEHVTLELQELAGTPVSYGRARETDEEGVYKVVVQYREEALARACLETARELCHAAVHNQPFDIPGTLARLREIAYLNCLGPSTASIVNAAKARGIPFRRLNQASLVQLGHGALQRRILTAETDLTGAIAQDIAQDKELTRTLLRAVGVPVPEGRPVTDAEDAWAAACEIGTPVVVKPRDANHGRGVAMGITTREQVMSAFEPATKEGEGVLVERYAPGAEYRLLVVGNRVVAAARREPPQVVGDGKSTIAQLVAGLNKDPRRSSDLAASLRTVEFDPAALEVLGEQGFNPESVLAAGTRVLIQRKVNTWTGGTATDVTDHLHPEVAARAVDAARAIGLDIAGIDLKAEDIGRPLEQQGGVVIEVNAGPGLQMHLEPTSGAPRPVGEAIVEMLFPEGQNGRVPIVAITGVNGKTTTVRLVAHILQQAGKRVGMTCTDGIYVDGRCIERGDCAGPQSARSVLLNPMVDAAVLETARGGILREGLGFDRCSVAVVTNIGHGDHLGLAGIETTEQLAYVKRTIVDVVLPEGAAVLKADDELVAKMAPYCKGSVIYFARDGQHPVITEHLAKGERAVFERDGFIVTAQGANENKLFPLSRVPLTQRGRVPFQVENVLAAAAAAWALAIPDPIVGAALASFTSDMTQVPGRFNVVEVDGATLILDFGHNPSAIEALVDGLGAFASTRRTVVFSADGDRRDDVITRQAELLAGAFDHVILYEEPYRFRGRSPGEIFALLRKGLSVAPKQPQVTEIHGEVAAIEAGLAAVCPGALVLIVHDDVGPSLERVSAFLASRQSEPASGTDHSQDGHPAPKASSAHSLNQVS